MTIAVIMSYSDCLEEKYSWSQTKKVAFFARSQHKPWGYFLDANRFEFGSHRIQHSINSCTAFHPRRQVQNKLFALDTSISQLSSKMSKRSSSSPASASKKKAKQENDVMTDKCINTVRILCAEMVEKANSGHPGAPMGCAPLAHVLFGEVMNFSPNNAKWFNRDRFVLSNGHACALQYAMLYLTGVGGLTLDDLKQFRQLGSKTPGHPENFLTPGVEVSTGPLGQGISNAVGLAMAERHLAATFNQPGFNLVEHYTYVICGDGCLQEGISSEACSLAGHLGLGMQNPPTIYHTTPHITTQYHQPKQIANFLHLTSKPQPTNTPLLSNDLLTTLLIPLSSYCTFTTAIAMTGKLIVLYDDNHITIDGDTNLAFTEDVNARYASYGWHVQVRTQSHIHITTHTSSDRNLFYSLLTFHPYSIRTFYSLSLTLDTLYYLTPSLTLQTVDDANDVSAVRAAVAAAQAETSRPSMIKIRTIIGFGSNKQVRDKPHSPLHTLCQPYSEWDANQCDKRTYPTLLATL